MSHVPSESPDISLLILKGHLLAEELLVDYIIRNIAHSEHINFEKSYWSFINKIELASSISNNQYHDVWVWTSLKKLNSLRNKISHGLEPKGLEKVILDFESSVKPHAPSKYKEQEVTLYGYVLFVVTGLFIVVKTVEGEMA